MISNFISLLLFSIIYVSISISHLNISASGQSSITEPFLLFTVSALLVVYMAKSNTPLSFKIPDLLYLLFIAYVISKNLLRNTLAVSSVAYLFFYLILYHSLKSIFSKINNSVYFHALLYSAGIILFTYLAFAVYHCYFEKETLNNLFIPNKSIFSILLASQVAFVLPLFFYLKNRNATIFLKFLHWLFLPVTAASLLLLISTDGRAGWIGFVPGLVYVGYHHLHNPRLKKMIVYLILPFLISMFALLFWYKPGSSGGRLLIFKISAAILKDNWLWGIGHGQFKVKYNEYQATYFSSHGIDSEKALLADNSFYTFNDLFQAAIENGLLGAFLIAALIISLALQIKKTATNSSNDHLFKAAVASLICIITGTLFSYPLQIFPIVIQVALCFSIINSYPSKKQLQDDKNKKGGTIPKIIMLIISILLFTHFSFYFCYKTKAFQAFELKRTGFKLRAIEKYKELNNSYIKDGNVLYLYAQELYCRNNLQEAAHVLNKAKMHYSSNEVYKLSASIECELQNFEQAEKDYKTAVYMVPNRMISRSNLLDFYLARKDTSNAIYWANSILNMPIKIPSRITGIIQQKTKEILMQMSK